MEKKNIINIGIYCMEKDEDDILEQWILHHSKITPLEKIYIIDNMSTSQKTADILKKYIAKGLNVSYEKDYKKKGDLIYNLINKTKPHIAIPIDLDEFIHISNTDKYVKSNQKKTEETEETEEIKCILERLYSEYIINGGNGRFSFKYYLTSNNDKLYYNDPINEINSFSIVDLKSHNKKFFIGSCLIGLDHGNHTGTVIGNSSQYKETNLILIHYHYRGILKLIEKCKNDIEGLNKVKNINNVSELTTKISQNVPGSHNIKTYKDFLMYGSYYFL